MPPLLTRVSLALLLAAALLPIPRAQAQYASAGPASLRQKISLSGSGWTFFGAEVSGSLPDVSSDAFRSAQWSPVTVPHVFQKRGDMTTEQGWYRRAITVPPTLAGRHLYLVFEGAAAIADVYVNGTSLGQHRGAYTRFIFDATAALKPGSTNELAVRVDNRLQSTTDCLPNGNRLYTVWGGLYRNVSLVATRDLQIDPTYFASPGIFITPSSVTSSSAQIQAKILLLNSGSASKLAKINCTLLDPANRPVQTFSGQKTIASGQRDSITLTTSVSRPLLWSPATPSVYHLRVDLADGAKPADSVTQPLGFRNLAFDFTTGLVQLNGKSITLYGADIHQETEKKASAIQPSDLLPNYDALRNLGATFVRLPHYPHAEFEYDLCDQRGLFCWAENGHSNREVPTPTADQITTEMVMQNFNHPSIAMWSVGNEASPDTAEKEVPVVRALDPSRPVMVANMKCSNADYHATNTYPGWYGKSDRWSFKPVGIITEVGAGGVVTSHTDYAAATHRTDQFEPEEYQQLIAETELNAAFLHNDGKLGIFTWWTLREFNDVKYKKKEAPFNQGINSKGLLTYGGDMKDVFYLFRSFSVKDQPTLHITSKRYFLREGAVDNGIKVYSNAPKVTLTLNGQKISTLDDGQYLQPDPAAQSHPDPIPHVFYWKTPLRTGRNEVIVTNDKGNTDHATIYFEGAGGAPELPQKSPLIKDLTSSNAANPAYFMDMPAEEQWPIYYDFDNSADNSLDLLPRELQHDPRGSQNPTWIALKRVTKPGQNTDISFTVAKSATVYILSSTQKEPPTAITSAGFALRPTEDLQWRDNAMHLVPAELYAKSAIPGDTIKLSLGDRDALILIKPR